MGPAVPATVYAVMACDWSMTLQLPTMYLFSYQLIWKSTVKTSKVDDKGGLVVGGVFPTKAFMPFRDYLPFQYSNSRSARREILTFGDDLQISFREIPPISESQFKLIFPEGRFPFPFFELEFDCEARRTNSFCFSHVRNPAIWNLLSFQKNTSTLNPEHLKHSYHFWNLLKTTEKWGNINMTEFHDNLQNHWIYWTCYASNLWHNDVENIPFNTRKQKHFLKV